MSIPLIDLKAQYKSIKDEVLAAINSVLDSGEYILGRNVAALESAVAELCGVKHGIGVASGTDALLLSLSALGIGPGDEVITTPYTFFSTAEVISKVGATPVFADIDPLTYNLDPNQAAKRITSRTRAIIPVHLFGQVADIDPPGPRPGAPAGNNRGCLSGHRGPLQRPQGRLPGTYGMFQLLSHQKSGRLRRRGNGGYR